MKIGIDGSGLSARSGGIRRYTEQLIAALSQVDSHNEYQILLRRPCDDAPVGGENIHWKTSRHPFRSWVDLFQPPRGVDLFHGLNYTAPLVGSSPTVLTIHDLTVHLFPEYHPRLRRIRHRMLPRMCRRASHLIADSHSTKTDLMRHYGISPQRIEVVHLAAATRFQRVSCDKTLREIRLRYELPDRFVLFVGSVEPRKNLSLLVRAMARILRDDPKLPLVIVGDIEPTTLSALSEVAVAEGLQLGSDVRFTGWIEDDALPAFYSLCELFVYPSRYEGFGLPPLEAMACGAPVLVPNNSSLTEMYRDCSLMLDLDGPDATDSLEAAIRRVLGSSLLRSELVRRGLQVAQSRTWQDVAAETIDIYRRAAA